jgi:hypothetical protein
VRLLSSCVLAALASFAAGFAGARCFQAHGSSPKAALAIQPSPPVRGLISEPADTSPDASKARIQAVITLSEKYRGLAEDHALFGALQKLDARDLLASADDFAARFKRESSPFGGQAVELAEAWTEHWLDLDAPAALRVLSSSALLKEVPEFHSLSSRVNGVEGAIFKILARRQSAWLQEYLTGLKPGPQQEVGIYHLLREGAQQDAAKARRLLADFSAGANRPAAVQGYVTGLATVDFRASFDTAAAEPAGPFREELLKVGLREAASRGVGAVRELLERIDDPTLRRALGGEAALEIVWRSRDDPLPWLMEEAQRTPASAVPKSGFDFWNNHVAQALQTIGSTAPAADWAMTLPNDPEKKLLLNILGDWRDPAGLRSWLTIHAVELDTTVLEKLGSALKNMIRTDAAGAGEWAAALPSGPLREQVQFQIALSSGAEGNLAQAAAAYESVAARDTTGALAKQLATVLATQDGAAAAEWAMGMPGGPARAAVVGAVAEQWSQRDPGGAAEWLEQMSSSAERDTAVREYAAKVVYADPAAAAEWVEQVADPDARAKAAEQVFYTWRFEDPVASHAWLRALPGVPEKWRADFLRKQK